MSSGIKPGMRVMVRDKKLLGVVRYVGLVEFAKGKWIGIELDEPRGKNNGTVQGKAYFECEPHHGMFVRQTQVEPYKEAGSKSSSPVKASRTASIASAATSDRASATASRPTSRTKISKPVARSGKSSTSSARSADEPPTEAGHMAKSPTKIGDAPTASKEHAQQRAQTERPARTSSKPAQPASNAAAPTAAAPAPKTAAAKQGVAPATQTAVPTNDGTAVAGAGTKAAPKRRTVVEAETDPVRVKELEKYKKQVEQLQQYKELWQEKQEKLMSELNERKRISDVDVQRLESELAMLKETTQIALLDKQVAEEKNQDQQEELEELQDRVEELTLSMEILEAEKDEAKNTAAAATAAPAASTADDKASKGGGAAAGAGGGEAETGEQGDPGALNPNQTNTTAAMKALKNKIARMTVALYKLREQNQTLQEENATVRQELTDAMADNSALSKALQMKDVALEKAMHEYKSQVVRADSHFSAETMVESLTEQNLALEERCQHLEEEVYELRQEADVLEETQSVLQETIDDMQRDNDEFQASVRKLTAVLNAVVDRNHEQAEAIAKYSATLRDKEESLKKTQEADVTSSTGQQQQHQQQHAAAAAAAAVSHKPSASTTQQRVAAIEAETRGLEAEQGRQHVEFLKMFLPEDFFTHDYKGLQLLMLLDRLMRKAAIVADHAAEEFAVGQDISEVVTQDSDLTIDQFAFGAALVELLTMLRLDCSYMHEAMHKVDDDKFQALGDVYPQLVAHEPAVDALLSRLRGDGLDPSIPLTDLEAAVKSFRTAVNTHLAPAIPRDSRDATHVDVTTASGALDVVEAELQRLVEVFHRSSSVGSMDPAFGPLLAHMREMSGQCRDAKVACRKVLRHLPPKMSDTTVSVDDERQAQLNQQASQLFAAAVALNHASKAYHDHVHGSVTLRALDLDTAMQIGVNARVDLSKEGGFAARAREEGADESMVPVHVPSVVYNALRLLTDVASHLETGDFDVQAAAAPDSTPPPAWERKAAAVRQSAGHTLALPREVERLTSEVSSLKKEVKVKEKDLKEKDILLVASKRSIESVRHQYEQQLQEKDAAVEQEREEFQRLRGDMDEQLRDFEASYEELSKERDELQKRLYAAEGPSLGGRITTAGSDVNSAELRAAQVRLFVLQEELAHQRRLTAQAQAKQALETLTQLPDIRPRKPLPTRMQGARDAVKDASSVCADVMRSMASLRVVRVRPSAAGAAPAAAAKREQAPAEPPEATAKAATARKDRKDATGSVALALAAGELERLRLTSQRARDSLVPLLSMATMSHPTLGAFASVDHLKRMHEAAQGKDLGTITLPSGTPISAARNRHVFLTPEAFHTLHSSLA